MNRIIVLFIAALLCLSTNAQSDFKKLSLDEAINFGLKNNPEMKAKSEKINAPEEVLEWYFIPQESLLIYNLFARVESLIILKNSSARRI